MSEPVGCTQKKFYSNISKKDKLNDYETTK